MIHALLHNKLKDSFSDPHFKPSEDSLTSSVIGLLQYLPDKVFWQLLRGSCGIQSCLPEDVGEILSINFWEKMLPDNKYNVRDVEPDVWIECEEYDIIIEAKKSDSKGQSETQWNKETVSFYKTFDRKNNRMIFLALGGNPSLRDFDLRIDDQQYTIYTSSWYNLLNEVGKYSQSLLIENSAIEAKRHIRLLNDIIAIFAKHGYLSINWLEDMEHISIKNNSANTISAIWTFDNKVLLQDFYVSTKPIITNNIFEIWKIK